jgi:D-amino-acid oxidase
MAVIGAGVVGLSTARVAQEQGYEVRIYAREFSPHTTSDLAGAEFSPDLVDRGPTDPELSRFGRMLVASWRRFVKLVGAERGVFRRPSYVTEDAAYGLADRSGLGDLSASVLPRGRRLARFPLPGPKRTGHVYETLLIEPPLYLPWLAGEVRGAGGQSEVRGFTSQAELLALPEPTVLNCTGLGARDLVRDRAVRPIKGQLVHMKPQRLSYLLEHADGYMFPRTDALVLGGSFEQDVWDTRIDETTTFGIIEATRRCFEPVPARG